MNATDNKHTVHKLAAGLSLAIDCRTRIETERRKVLDRDVIELRVFLLESSYRISAGRWVSTYCKRLVQALDKAGLELAADEWFTPSQAVPSCGVWVSSRAPGQLRAIQDCSNRTPGKN